MAWADLQLPETQLATMLATCQVWRGITAYPTYQWDELATELDAVALGEGAAAAKIATSRLADSPDDPNWIDYPRAAVSHQDEDGYSRTSVSTHDIQGRLFLMVEFLLPADLEKRKDGAAKDDVRRKAFALISELLAIPRQYPYLDIEGVSAESGVVYSQANSGIELGVIQATITYRGGV